MKVCANQNKICVGKGGNAISQLCTIKATKNVLVDGSAEPSSRGILVWRRDKWIKHRNETSSDIFKLKNCVHMKNMNWLKGNCLLKLQQDGWWQGR